MDTKRAEARVVRAAMKRWRAARRNNSGRLWEAKSNEDRACAALERTRKAVKHGK